MQIICTSHLTSSHQHLITQFFTGIKPINCYKNQQYSQVQKHTHTHTTVLQLFWNMSGTTRVSRYQKGKTRKVITNLDLLEQESEWQWHLLGYMQVCTSSQTTTPTSHHSVFYRPDAFLPPNQQRQSTEWKITRLVNRRKMQQPTWSCSQAWGRHTGSSSPLAPYRHLFRMPS